MSAVQLVRMPDTEPDRFGPDLGEPRMFVPRTVFWIVTAEETVGEVVFYNADTTNRTCWLSVGFHPAHRRTAWPWGGVVLALDWAFAQGMRQVYVEALEHLAAQFSRPVRQGWMREVGRLPEAWWHEGRYEDLVNYVIRRDDWLEARNVYLPLLAPRKHAA
jgi:RimJ/RimL family protein N-acetyltransferase